MIFAVFNENGRPLGFYPSDVWSKAPDGAVAITPEQHEALLTSDRWVYVGGELVAVELEPPAPVVPASISRFQARAALLAAGLLDDVEAAVAESGDFERLAWAEAMEWRRDSPTLMTLAAGVGLSEAEIDDLFVQAAQISA